MNSYTFVFFIGLLNLTIPFLGVPTSYKNVAFISLGVVTLFYALIIRAIIKEREAGLVAQTKSTKEEYSQYKVENPVVDEQTITDVVEMSEQDLTPRTSRVVVSDMRPKKRGPKPKIKVIEEVYE